MGRPRGRIIASGFRIERNTRPGMNTLKAPAPAPPPVHAAAWKSLTLDLATARTDVTFEISGDVLDYTDSTNSTDLVQIRFDGLTSDKMPFRPGKSVTGRPFTRILVTNAAIAGATATLMYTTSPAGTTIRLDD